jgi:L,D-peptidoglycan transpeptidase YkuD (ErfK/YbiS/YcfS/YnhG family)
VLAAARQLVLVSADGWDATGGTLRRYARVSPRAAWEPVGDPVRVTLGRTGMAWGVGQGARPNGAPTKREGDGRSPAGAYALLHTFGTAPTDAAPSTYPHLPLRAGTVCVDDPGAATYNAIVDGDTTGRGAWASGERMWRVAGYRLGVVVAYNGARTRAGGVRAAAAGARPVPGRGSCIFLHVWDGPDRTTEGCTAMEATALAAVVAWLDPRARPALVQLPASVASGYAGRWALP